MNWLRTLYILLACLFPVLGQSQSGVYVHPSIQDYLAEGDSLSCMLVLHDQVGEMNVDKTESKEEKALHVYQILSSLAADTQRPVLDSLDRWNVPYRSFYIVNAIQARLDSASVNKLEQFSNLRSILPDFPLVKLPEAISPGDVRRMDTLLNWGISHVRADSVWRMGFTGEGVVVAGLDTGVESNNDFLRTSYRGYQTDGTLDHNYNWYDAIRKISILNADDDIQTSSNPCGLETRIPCDDNGHGTFTMGIMTGHSENQYTGVAPGARWIGSRVMERGDGQLSTYLSGLEWCLAPTDTDGKAPRPALAPDIINNSWACPKKEGCIPENYWILDTATARLTQAGIFVVASAGNSGREGCSSLTSPLAIFTSVFTVGATDRKDSITAFSSRGPLEFSASIKPDVVAPGNGITSVSLNGNLQKSSGTSISAPIVVGVAALILEANPELKGRPDLLRKIITESAIPIYENPCTESQHPNSVYGYGRIDALNGVQLAMEFERTNKIHILPENSFDLDPNPFSPYLRISSFSDVPARVSIYNLQGKLIEQFLLESHASTELHMPGLQSGLYFARIVTKQGVFLRKLVKY